MWILAHIFRNLKYLPNNSDTACFSMIVKLIYSLSRKA